MAAVADYMSRDLVVTEPDTALSAAAALMAQKRIGSVLVAEGGRLIGIFTERDIVRAVSQDVMAMTETVSDWMTRGPLTVAPGTSIDEARDLMLEHHFRHLPVMDGTTLCGMISMRDVTRAASNNED